MDFYFRNDRILLMKRIFLVLFLFLPFLVFAQGIVIPNPLTATSIEEVIEGIVDFLFYVALAVAPLMWIIAGLLLTFAAGDPKKVDTAKKIAFYTVIGFAIVMFAKGIISVLKDILGG
ncbi:hypothetical protein AMJ49_02185 [Parcubacteria bacterium DG_74_2]|nr:MAG: hypothetical protein AMJ49_02185 [Parcubacteria bacterium DG_74_2]